MTDLTHHDDCYLTHHACAIKEVERQRAELAEAREVMAFYGDRENYAPGRREYWGGETEPCAPPIFSDMGARARAFVGRGA